MNINRLKPGLHIFIGVPGSGKTTYAAALCKKFMKSRKFKGKNCFSNVPILGTYRYSPRDDMGKNLLEDGLIICDEAGIEFNGRQWKSMSEDCIEFAKTYRHYGLVHFCFFSQAVDIDQTFIRLANSAHHCHKVLFWVFLRDYVKVLVQDENHQFIFGWRPVPVFRGGLHCIFAPLYWKMFDTFEFKPLPVKDYPLWDDVNRYPEFYSSQSHVEGVFQGPPVDYTLSNVSPSKQRAEHVKLPFWGNLLRTLERSAREKNSEILHNTIDTDLVDML